MTKEAEREALSEKLHEWYLEATQTLKRESFNPNAQKKYKDLSDEQKQIDRYIAERVDSFAEKKARPLVEALEEIVTSKDGNTLSLGDCYFIAKEALTQYREGAVGE